MSEKKVETPQFCDFSCQYATLENTQEMTGACRRELVLWCSHYKKIVKKNDLCITEKRKLREKDPEYQMLFGNKKSD